MTTIKNRRAIENHEQAPTINEALEDLCELHADAGFRITDPYERGWVRTLLTVPIMLLKSMENAELTDIRELEKIISPPPLTDEQLHTIAGFLAHSENMIKDDDYDKVLAFIEVKYARAMSEMTRDRRCVAEIIIRVNNDAEVRFRVRGLDVKCRVWSCLDEFDL